MGSWPALYIFDRIDRRFPSYKSKRLFDNEVHFYDGPPYSYDKVSDIQYSSGSKGTLYIKCGNYSFGEDISHFFKDQRSEIMGTLRRALDPEVKYAKK